MRHWVGMRVHRGGMGRVGVSLGWFLAEERLGLIQFKKRSQILYW